MSRLRLLIGTRKGLVFFESEGNGFRAGETAHLAVPITYAMSDPRDGTLWASLDHGHWGQKLSRSRDGGKSWEEVAAPVYPEDAIINKPASDPSAEPETIPAKLENVWVIEAGGEDQPSRLYLGTNPGGLFRSDDGGDSFELVRGLWDHPTRLKGWFGGGRDTPGIHSVVVDPRDSRRVLIGISCAGVFETTDDGESWEPRNKGMKADFLPDPNSEVGQDPHFITACPRHPDALWQQNHCGVYRSVDGAASWELLSEAGQSVHFGFPVAVDEENPEEAWVVPAVADQTRVAVDGALFVGHTLDGGKTWSEHRKGLPQENCFDIVFRHALDKRGDHLVFGTTTGNLFVSSDRGESWTCLSHHLPPIYSVRFA